MYVHAASGFVCDPITDLERAKEELKQYTDYFFRRVNKFILLSLLGVHRCVHERPADESVAVFLATENGNLGDTENVLRQIYRENSFPKPFNFINTMSNTASFYVAQSLNTRGRSITVSSKASSFERGLEMAMADLSLGQIREALVGGVDEAASSRDEFHNKYKAAPGHLKLVEGSSWMLLSAAPEGAMGEILDVRTFSTFDEARAWADSLEPPLVLAFGILVPMAEKDVWKQSLPHAEEFDYLGGYGFYDTAAAFAVCRFFEDFRGRTLVHVNKTPHGGYCLIGCRSY